MDDQTNFIAAIKEAAEILGDMTDVANACGSAYLYRRDAGRVKEIARVLLASVKQNSKEE